jgi:hypothetical protein
MQLFFAYAAAKIVLLLLEMLVLLLKIVLHSF